MKIAVIGSGIAGLAATWYLSKHYQVTLCERGPNIGMDAHSIELDAGLGAVYINAPMRVFFEGYYPELNALYDATGIACEPINYSGSFSRRGGRAYFHYKNHWLGNLALPFVTGRSLRSPSAWRLGLQLVRFLRHARKLDMTQLTDALTIEDFLRQNGYANEFADAFLYPTFAAICTCSYEHVKAYPASIILDYLNRDLTWSKVHRLSHGVRDVAQRLSAAATTVRCNMNVQTIQPTQNGVVIRDGDNYQESFDHVVVATQANQAHRLLPESMQEDRLALAQIKYQRSRLVVHKDRRLAPDQSSDWAPVNFLLCREQDKPAASIWMNSIYPELKHGDPVFETWNPFDDLEIQNPLIDVQVDRPLVTRQSLQAVDQLQRLQLVPNRKIWLCGSYANRGIPLLESAVSSAKQVAETIVAQNPTR